MYDSNHVYTETNEAVDLEICEIDVNIFKFDPLVTKIL